jgi:bifunctional UDP-N-acetylglucosamine pyrophosphorylase/glucosamine-1-phosphate N-acetyltransferase
MKSARSKVLHDLAGRPVISYIIDEALKIGSARTVVVRGPLQADLGKYLEEAGLEQAVQKQPLGTANAVASARKTLENFEGYVLVLCGDVPLVRKETLEAFTKEVFSKSAMLGVLTMQPDFAAGYGRIVRDLDGKVVKIVEAKDASEDELKIREVNSGVLCFDSEWLFKSLKKVGCENAKGEYYLTDLVGIALKEDLPVVAWKAENYEELLGINTRVDLARTYELLRERINKEHMLSGVGIQDIRHTNIDSGVKIGVDTTIMPYAFIGGKTKIGSNCVIENGVVIKDCIIENGVHIKAYSVLEKSHVRGEAVIGPFARLRPDSKIGRKAKVGNFVELKKCEMKNGAKANHLTYLGDAVVGERANVGCGTITCNYDGYAKYMTIIGDDAFIGSDTQFVAPVRIGKGAVIGAGSTITKNVPAGDLSLSRAPQTFSKGWSKRRGDKMRSKK